MTVPTFADEIHQTPLNLARAALRMAQEIAYPELDIEHYLERIEQLAVSAAASLDAHRSWRSQAISVADSLFVKAGLQGNADHYRDPRNSYLNQVLDRRLGIPISLSVIYLSVAQRLDLPAYGVGLPGHFIVGVHDAQEEIYLDPFYQGRLLSVIDCARLVHLTTGSSQPFKMEWLNPAPAGDVLTRMLFNLRSNYMQNKNWAAAIRVLEHLRLLQPDDNTHIRDLGLVHHYKGSLRLAVQFYEQYLTNTPQATDIASVRRNMQSAAYQLTRLN